jgi:hypothetical protein
MRINTVMLEYSKATAEVIGWPVSPSQRQPEGTVLSTGLHLCFIYPGREEGQWVLMIFESPESVSYGTPNISELDSHPLTEKAPPGAFCVIHASPWKEYARALNEPHSCYRPEYWGRINHYFAFLWDYTFECLALGFRTEEFSGSHAEALSRGAEAMKSTNPLKIN